MDDAWIDAGPSDALHTDGRTLLHVQNQAIAVFLHNGTPYAIADSCPHAGASLCRGRVDSGQVQCPAHGLKFDLRSGRMGNTTLTVPTFAVREEGGRLLLRLPPA